MNENPVALGMLGGFFVTLGFVSGERPEATLFIDPKYLNDDGDSDWMNDR